MKMDRLHDSRRIREEVYQARVKVLGADHMDTLGTKLGLANTVRLERQFAEAERLFRETLDTQIRLVGPESRRLPFSSIISVIAPVSARASASRN
jgi:hypothetical protein